MEKKRREERKKRPVMKKTMNEVVGPNASSHFDAVVAWSAKLADSLN